MYTSRHKGFTLAEVLITLGIIGIVAAMTLPTIIDKYKKMQTAVAVKKVYTEMIQTIKRAEVDYGEFKNWDINSDANTTYEINLAFGNKYLQPYFKNLRPIKEGMKNVLWDNNGISTSGANFITNNGTIISISVHSSIIFALIDINGYKKPNKMGNDIFYFNTLTGKFMPSGWKTDLTREEILQGYTGENGLKFSCKKSKTNNDDDYTDYRHACTALLMIDGWEIKDDYPW